MLITCAIKIKADYIANWWKVVNWDFIGLVISPVYDFDATTVDPKG
jgi:hypothetical protein